MKQQPPSFVLERIFALPFIAVLRIWHYAIAPVFGSRCRFYPSCSEYASEALHRHGVIHGGWLSMKRVSRCHSLCAGGVDYVP